MMRGTPYTHIPSPFQKYLDKYICIHPPSPHTQKQLFTLTTNSPLPLPPRELQAALTDASLVLLGHAQDGLVDARLPVVLFYVGDWGMGVGTLGVCVCTYVREGDVMLMLSSVGCIVCVGERRATRQKDRKTQNPRTWPRPARRLGRPPGSRRRCCRRWCR